jgi:hypothetical protein
MKTFPRPRRGVTGAISFAASIALGLAAHSGNTPLAPAFEAGIGTHQTRAEIPNANKVTARIETVSVAPPTRSTFMATWESMSGAKGYRLDVSTSDSFSTYVDGYHDLDVGNVIRQVVTGLHPGTTYYYRVRPYTSSGAGSYSGAITATTAPATGLIINPTFDTSITNDPDAAAIEAMISRAISIYESLFADPFTIQILFRYATTEPDGSPLPPGVASQSNLVVYLIPWNPCINALIADATTSNDAVANGSLPGDALSATTRPSSANGRAMGLDTPTAMFADGHIGNGGPYDGIVTLNSALPYQFTRPTSDDIFDAQRSTEHEIDEVIGLGSRLGQMSNDVRPQDFFSWSSAGVRNLSSSGTRYFSIDSGATNIVNFSQDPTGDFGDWLSEACPQTQPYVQNAFICSGQYSDISATSPEGINLDVVGYDLVGAAFFMAEVLVGNGVYYLQFPNGTPFGYYAYLTDQRFIYHFDMGFEYLFDANDANHGIYFYDFASSSFLYTSPSTFPYLYDFSLNAWLYYLPDANNPGRYTHNPRWFYNFATGQWITL